MNNSLQGVAATAKDAYPRDNFHGESSDQSFSYPNSQQQQISQSQGYPPKDDFQFPYSSQLSLPSVLVLPSQQIPPKNDYLSPSSQTLEHPKQLKTLNGSHQSSHQCLQQQQVHSVRALPFPQNPPKSNNHPPSFQTSDQSQQQEPLNGVPSQGYSTKDNHHLQSPGSFNHPQHQQKQPSSPQVPLWKQNDHHPPTSSNRTSHQSQPKQPPNGVPLETHPTKDHLQSNQPQKQQPPIEVPSKDQHPSKNKNQSQQQLPSALPPSNDNFLVPSSLNTEQPVLVGFAVPSTTQGNRPKPQTLWADPPQPEKDKYPIKKYAGVDAHAKQRSDEPVLAFPDPRCLPESYLNQLPMYVPETRSPPPPPKRSYCCSIL